MVSMSIHYHQSPFVMYGITHLATILEAHRVKAVSQLTLSTVIQLPKITFFPVNLPVLVQEKVEPI